MKQRLRKTLSEKRLRHTEVKEKSRKIQDFLFSLPEYMDAEKVLFYMSIKNEVETWDMVIEAMKEKTVLIPVTENSGLLLSELIEPEFEKGAYGVLEPKNVRPIAPEYVDLAIIPGIGFDRVGGRIGYGKGYYDKLLKDINKTLAVEL